MFDSTKYKSNYNAQNYYGIKIRLPKEKRNVIDKLVETTGKSINRIFIEAVEKQHNVDLTIVEEKLNSLKD